MQKKLKACTQDFQRIVSEGVSIEATKKTSGKGDLPVVFKGDL